MGVYMITLLIILVDQPIYCATSTEKINIDPSQGLLGPHGFINHIWKSVINVRKVWPAGLKTVHI